MSKKIISIILALIMVLGLSVISFADDDPTPQTYSYTVQYLKRSNNSKLAEDKIVENGLENTEQALLIPGYIYDTYKKNVVSDSVDGILTFYYEEYIECPKAGEIIQPGDYICLLPEYANNSFSSITVTYNFDINNPDVSSNLGATSLIETGGYNGGNTQHLGVIYIVAPGEKGKFDEIDKILPSNGIDISDDMNEKGLSIDDYYIDIKPVKHVTIENRDFVWDDEYTSFAGWNVKSSSDNISNLGESIEISLSPVWVTREPTSAELFRDNFKIKFLTFSYRFLDFLGSGLESFMNSTIDAIAELLGYSK